MLAQAIAAQAAWKARPDGVEREKSPNSPAIPSMHMHKIYAPHMKTWEEWAKEEPRRVGDLRDKMKELAGYRPPECSIGKWADDRSIIVESDRRKIGLSRIAKELVGMRTAGLGIDAIIAYCLTQGFDVTSKQVYSSMSNETRKGRA